MVNKKRKRSPIRNITVHKSQLVLGTVVKVESYSFVIRLDNEGELKAQKSSRRIVHDKHGTNDMMVIGQPASLQLRKVCKDDRVICQIPKEEGAIWTPTWDFINK